MSHCVLVNVPEKTLLFLGTLGMNNFSHVINLLMLTAISRLIIHHQFLLCLFFLQNTSVQRESCMFICVGCFTMCFHMTCAGVGEKYYQLERFLHNYTNVKFPKPKKNSMQNGDRMGWLDLGECFSSLKEVKDCPEHLIISYNILNRQLLSNVLSYLSKTKWNKWPN